LFNKPIFVIQLQEDSIHYHDYIFLAFVLIYFDVTFYPIHNLNPCRVQNACSSIFRLPAWLTCRKSFRTITALEQVSKLTHKIGRPWTFRSLADTIMHLEISLTSSEPGGGGDITFTSTGTFIL